MVIGKISIRPTHHYLLYHSDVAWDHVVQAILSPTKTRQTKRHGKNRFTYVKRFKKFVIEVHVEKTAEFIYVINAFKMGRD